MSTSNPRGCEFALIKVCQLDLVSSPRMLFSILVSLPIKIYASLPKQFSPIQDHEDSYL